MFLMAFAVQEMAVSQIQVAKQCWDNFSRVLIFVVWDSFANIVKNCTLQNKYVYGIHGELGICHRLTRCLIIRVTIKSGYCTIRYLAGSYW